MTSLRDNCRMKILPRDLLALRTKQVELLDEVRSRHPEFSRAPEEVLVELLPKEDYMFYMTLAGTIARYGT